LQNIRLRNTTRNKVGWIFIGSRMLRGLNRHANVPATIIIFVRINRIGRICRVNIAGVRRWWGYRTAVGEEPSPYLGQVGEGSAPTLITTTAQHKVHETELLGI
jgi:hypothetical protein